MNLSEQTKIIQSFIQSHPQVSSISDSDELHKLYMQLIDCLVDHNHLYYVESTSIISDKEYDDLFTYLKKIEELHPEIISSNSPTQGLIGQVSEWFLQAKHTVKLASLENTYNAEDLNDRGDRIKKIVEKEKISPNISYIIEPKFDGISVELIYKAWRLDQAITRGDWRVGEDITDNVKTIKNIPQKLKNPVDIAVRWEIMMPKSVWSDINKEREENWEIPFANTRNATSGSIKLLDSKEVAKRKLACFIYDILQCNDEIINLESLWLPIFPRIKECSSIQEVMTTCLDPQIKQQLESEDFDFDGLVIKVKDQLQRDILWSTDHHPRWAVAYKFPAQLAATKIVSVDFQIGRTWIITPVGNLEPIELSGVTIKRVSLHNFDFIQSKDLHIGDYVWIQRSGEVIPYIVGVIKERRTEAVQDIQMPSKCPSCLGKVVNQDMHYYCTNPVCPAKLKEQILHFVSKNCMDIQWIWESIVDILVGQNIVQSIADIYRIPEHTTQILLRKFPGIGDKKVSEIANEIEESKHQPLRRLLNGLGIPHVGKKMAQDIVQAMVSQQPVCLEDILYILTDRDFLITVYGIGDKTLDALVDYFSDTQHQEMLMHLRDIGMKFTVDAGGYDLFKEKKETFSITGTFPFPREEIVAILEKEGYIFHDNPTKSTQLMLIGEKAGSKKEKAQEFWLTIYEGWETLTQRFPILATLKNNDASQQPKITQTSLFG
jgi:DNA ligase (NAD+)